MGTEQRLEVRSQGAKAWGLVVLAELDMRSQCELRAGALVGARDHHRRPPTTVPLPPTFQGSLSLSLLLVSNARRSVFEVERKIPSLACALLV